MAEEKRFYVDLNLKGSSLKEFKLEHLEADPEIGTLSYEARMYYNTTEKRIKFFDGTEWLAVSAGADGIKDIVPAVGSEDYITVTVNPETGVATIGLQTIDAGNIEHQELSGAGVHDHAVIDAHIDSTANPHGTTLEQARAAGNVLAGEIAMGSNKITGLANGTAAGDAINLGQLQAAELGLKIANHVQWATTDELTVNASGSQATKALIATTPGALAIDGGAPAVGERILVKNQVNPVNNGIYVVSVTGDATNPFELTRDTAFDDDPSPELLAGMYFFVQYGTANNATGWVVSAIGANHDQDPIVDTDPVTFVQFTAANSYSGEGAIVIDGSVIKFNAVAAAGKGLISYNNQLEVENYNPKAYTEVAISQTMNNIPIGIGNTFITHNMEGRVVATIYDSADNMQVEVGIKYVDNNKIQILSNIAFNANIELVRTANIPPEIA